MSGREAQAEVQRSPERAEEKPSRESAGGSPDIGHLARLALPVGSPGGPGSVLRRAVSHPGLAAPALLQLQRQLGNRHVQRMVALAREAPSSDGEITPEVEQSIAGARGGGRPLDSEVRGRMESSFGTDFSGVRVHTGGEADRLNRRLSARAFTTGSDVFFRDGEYRPGSSAGRELIAHELTHVVQQQGTVQTSRLTLGPPGDRFEQEADSVARQVMRDEEVEVAPGGEGAARSLQRKAGPRQPGADEPQPLRVPAGTFDQAAANFASALRQQNPTANIGIVVVNGMSIRVYDLQGQRVGGSFRLIVRNKLGTGVFGKLGPDSEDRLLYQVRQKNGVWEFSAKGAGGEVDFDKDVEPREEFAKAAGQFRYVYYVVPEVRPEVVPDEDLPLKPEEETPEFMKFKPSEEKAQLPAYPSAVVPLTPQVTAAGTTGKFYCRLDKILWTSTIDNVAALLERVNFKWEVLKLDAKLLVTDTERATRWDATKQRFRTKARHIREDEKTMRGDENASVPEQVYREYLTAQMAAPRRILGYTGEAVMTLMHSLVGRGDPNVEDYIDFTFKEPGDYFVRCLATPVMGSKAKKRRATSVAGVLVSVFDLKDVAVEAIDTPEEILGKAVEKLEAYDADLAKMREERANAPTEERKREIDLRIGMFLPRRAYLEAVQRAGGDPHATLAAELELTRAQLAFATGKQAPRFIYTPNQITLRQLIEKLKADEKRYAGQLERADAKLGDNVRRTGLMSAILLDDVTGARQQVLLSIGERRYIAADRTEVVVADITSPKGRRFTGMGSGLDGQARSDAWTAAMRDLQRNLGRGRGWLSYQAPSPYSGMMQALTNPMQLQVAELDQIKDVVDDALNAATLAALVAAPFTGGASLGLLAVLVPVTFGSSLYNIVNRAMYDDLELDADAVFSLLDIASFGVAKVGAMGKVARRSVGMMSMNGRIALGLLDGGGYVLLSYTTYAEIMKDVPGETPQEARVRKLRALLGLFQAASIPVAGKLFGPAGLHPDGTLPKDETAADAPVADKTDLRAEAPAGPAPKPDGAPAVPKEYADALQGVAKKVPPVINPALDKDTVRIRYEQTDGVITRMWMEIGPGTSAGRVKQHAPTARDMARYMGLSGRVRKIYQQIVEWLSSHPVAGPESRAWEAEREVRKLQRMIDEQFAAYDKAVAENDTALRDELSRELDHLESQLLAHARDVDKFDVEGRGFVAAEGTGGAFSPETSRGEAFRELGGFDVRARDGRVVGASDLRQFVDAVLGEKLAGGLEDVVRNMPDPKGLSPQSVLAQIKDPYLAKLVERASDPKRLQGLASYRKARSAGETPERALHEAAAAEAQRIADKLPEADREAFVRAWTEKPAAAPVPRRRPEDIEAETLAPEPAPRAEEPAPAPVPESTRAAQAWLDRLRSEVPESAQRRLDGIARGKRPEETKALVERLGGKEYLVGGALAAEARAAALKASPERAAAIKKQLGADDTFLAHPEVQQAIASGDAAKLRSEMAAEMAAKAALEAQARKGVQGARALRGVYVVREQPYPTVAEARKALNAQSQAQGRGDYAGVIYERGGKVYTISTDIDVLVIQDVPGQPSKVLRLEEVKSGERDTPGEARGQVDTAAERLAEIAAGDKKVRLMLPDGTDITATIDAASAAGAEKATRGALDNTRKFDAHMDVTSRDLLKAAQDMMAEQQRKKTLPSIRDVNMDELNALYPEARTLGEGQESDWIPATNAAGAEVYLSLTPVSALAAHVEGIVIRARRTGQKVSMITGFHGSASGSTRAEKRFADADAKFYREKYPDVDVIDASDMTHAQRLDLIDSTSGVVIVNTCYGACVKPPAAPAAPSPAPAASSARSRGGEPAGSEILLPPAPVYKTLDELLTPDKDGFTDKDLQEAYTDYIAKNTRTGDPVATPEEWVSLTRGGPRARLETLLGPDYAFGGRGTGVERQLPLTDFARPATYTQQRLDADMAAVEADPGKLWERLGRLQADGVAGGVVGESLFNILKGNAAEILSRPIQAAGLAKVQAQHPDARLYDDVRARVYGKDGKLTDWVLFTDNVIASKRGQGLQLHAVFEVKAGSKGGQEATTQVFDWIESKLDDKIEIRVGGDTYVYEPGSKAANQVIGLARADRHLIAARGAEHLGLDSGDQIARASRRHALPQNAEEINFLTRALIEKHIKQNAAAPTPAPAAPATPAGGGERIFLPDPEMFKRLSEGIDTRPRASYSVMIEHHRMPSPEQMRELFRDRTPAPAPPQAPARAGASSRPRYGLIETVQGVNVRRAMADPAELANVRPGNVLPGLEGMEQEALHAVHRSRDVRPGSLIVREAEKLVGRKGDLWFSPSPELAAQYANDFDGLIRVVQAVMASY